MKKRLPCCERPCDCSEVKKDIAEITIPESNQIEEAKKMGLITTARTADIDSWIKISDSLPNNILYSLKYPGNLFVESSIESGTNYYKFWKNKESYERFLSCSEEMKNREEEKEIFDINDKNPCWNIYKENMIFGLSVSREVTYSITYKTSNILIYDGIQGSHNFNWTVPKDIESGALGGYVFNDMYALGESSLGTKLEIIFKYFTDGSEVVKTFTKSDPYQLFINILSTFELYQ